MWFDNLLPREQISIIAGCSIILIILTWAFAWNPLKNSSDELNISIIEKNDLYASLAQVESIQITTPRYPQSSVNQSLVVLVDQTHRNHGLNGTLSRNQPEGVDGILVAFQRCSFDRLIGWLGDMQDNYAIKVESASIDSSIEPGLVNATLVLRRT